MKLVIWADTILDIKKGLVQHIVDQSNGKTTAQEVFELFENKISSNKKQKMLSTTAKKLFEDEQFFKSLVASDHSINALRDMLKEGVDAYLYFPTSYTIYTTRSVAQNQFAVVSAIIPTPLDIRLDWIKNALGKEWVDRVIICSTSVISGVKCDYFIVPQGENIQSPHVVYSSSSFPSWKDWRKNVGIEVVETMSKTIPFFRHGSHNSVDVDLLYLFDHIPPPKEAQNFIFVGERLGEDRNIFTIKDGVVNFCQVGIVDSMNNALLQTYPLHKQLFPLPIIQAVKRAVPMKINETIKNTLVKIRNADNLRDIIVPAIKSYDFEIRRQVFGGVDFAGTTLDLDTIKNITFRLGQTLALIQGHECFTKDDVIKLFPDMKPLIYREKDLDKNVMNKYKDIFMKETDGVMVKCVGDLHLYYVVDYDIPMNFFRSQCNGLVVDYRFELLRCFPLNHYCENKPSWPEDPSHPVIDPTDPDLFIVFRYVPTKSSELPKWYFNKHQVVICQYNSFDSELLQNAYKTLDSENTLHLLDTCNYYYVLLVKHERVEVVAKRNRLTNLLAYD
ncbi:hypothetical protein AKO1_002927 [Acrasis kona]|uniref:Uncharacterized protein n=1 Tax=Acrasis kona TaxID=1008807 RepID=A0AAW2Z788_9EUKA